MIILIEGEKQSSLSDIERILLENSLSCLEHVYQSLNRQRCIPLSTIVDQDIGSLDLLFHCGLP